MTTFFPLGIGDDPPELVEVLLRLERHWPRGDALDDYLCSFRPVESEPVTNPEAIAALQKMLGVHDED